jgi:predicted N-formylglutamate amidohydrolase
MGYCLDNVIAFFTANHDASLHLGQIAKNVLLYMNNRFFCQRSFIRDGLQLFPTFSNSESMQQNSNTFELINPKGRFPLVLTCEHASYALPREYQNLGLSPADVQRHIGWDIGARSVVAYLGQALDAPAICSRYSRLLIDCNRDLNDHDLIVYESDRTVIMGNRDISSEERQNRIKQFYRPYHEAIDGLLTERRGRWPVTLLSIHRFTPVLGKKERRFDFGVLFDRYEDLAQEVGGRLGHEGHRVLYNEPYSGYDGLIFSARSHGERNELVYLELEVNNSLIASAEGAQRIATVVSRVCLAMFSQPRNQEPA